MTGLLFYIAFGVYTIIGMSVAWCVARVSYLNSEREIAGDDAWSLFLITLIWPAVVLTRP